MAKSEDIYYIKFPKIIERNSVVTSKFPVKNLQRFNNLLSTHIKYPHDINEYIGRQLETLKIEIISILKIWPGIKNSKFNDPRMRTPACGCVNVDKYQQGLKEEKYLSDELP